MRCLYIVGKFIKKVPTHSLHLIEYFRTFKIKRSAFLNLNVLNRYILLHCIDFIFNWREDWPLLDFYSPKLRKWCNSKNFEFYFNFSINLNWKNSKNKTKLIKKKLYKHKKIEEYEGYEGMKDLYIYIYINDIHHTKNWRYDGMEGSIKKSQECFHVETELLVLIIKLGRNAL